MARRKRNNVQVILVNDMSPEQIEKKVAKDNIHYCDGVLEVAENIVDKVGRCRGCQKWFLVNYLGKPDGHFAWSSGLTAPEIKDVNVACSECGGLLMVVVTNKWLRCVKCQKTFRHPANTDVEFEPKRETQTDIKSSTSFVPRNEKTVFTTIQKGSENYSDSELQGQINDMIDNIRTVDNGEMLRLRCETRFDFLIVYKAFSTLMAEYGHSNNPIARAISDVYGLVLNSRSDGQWYSFTQRVVGRRINYGPWSIACPSDSDVVLIGKEAR